MSQSQSHRGFVPRIKHNFSHSFEVKEATMSITPPERIWWKSLHTEEKVWLGLGLAFTLATFFFMPVWHVIGSQNPPSESYKVSPAQFRDRVSAFVEQYVLKDEAGEGKEKKGITIFSTAAGMDFSHMRR